MPGPIDVERAKKLHEQGWTATQIANELGCDPSTVQRARRNGFPQPKVRVGFIDRGRVLHLTKLGWSATKIAEELKCTTRQVVRIRAQLEISQPLPENAGVPLDRNSERYRAAERLADDGASIGEISRTMHMTTATVAKYFPHAKQEPGDWMHLWGQIRNKPHLRRLFDEMGGIT